MSKQVKILLQTTIPYTEDDWHIGRFSLLTEYLRSLKNPDGGYLYDVTARDRQNDDRGIDPVLSSLDTSDFDQLWLFAVDVGDGLAADECRAITGFMKRGGGLLTARDHNDLGSSLCSLGGIGSAHYFHSKNQDPDEERHSRDDNITLNIDWPNYHSGANGDYQVIEASDHELLRRSDGTLIEYFPAHPHEGAVGVPGDHPTAQIIAAGTSRVTLRPFNLLVSFDSFVDSDGKLWGRGIAESSFHHLVDYNWDTDSECPTFVEERPGDGYKRDPEKLDDIRQFVANAAKWLST